MLPPSSSRSAAPSRRTFLTSASLALASLPFTTRSLAALPRVVGSGAASRCLPDPVPDDALRAFATAAIDAARAAGAAYADIRIADTPSMGVSVIPGGKFPPIFGADGKFAFGIRAIVDGACSFVYGDRPDLDLMTTAAKKAVASALGVGRRRALLGELGPAPVVRGEWETPMVTDPFEVPLQAHWDVLGGYIAMGDRVKYGMVSEAGIRWSRDTRVFASTEGSLVTQRFHEADFNVKIASDYWSGFDFSSLGGPLRAAGGFELATDPALHEHIVRRAELAVRLGSYPTGRVDIGRYDIVASGEMMARLVGQTMGPAFEIDRVLGYEAGATGTSYLAPLHEVVGTPTLSPLLTITNARDMPSSQYARWDDEGVECGPVTLVDRGQIVDFLTSRTTAGMLRSWYERQGRAVRSNGNCVTGDPSSSPSPRPGHITIQASPAGPTLDELCHGVKRGLLIYNGGLNIDQQLASLFCGYISGFEILNGRITRAIEGAGLQAATKRLWSRSLKALGGTSTVENQRTLLFKSQPTQYSFSTVSSPAGLFTDIDVIRVS